MQPSSLYQLSVLKYTNLYAMFSLFWNEQIHLIKKRLSSELLHCALLHTQTAKHHGCNEFVHCCMPRPQTIVFHIASVANTRMSLSHSRYLQCYLNIRYIHGALWSRYATIHNAQCNNSEDNLFWIRCIQNIFYKPPSLRFLLSPRNSITVPWNFHVHIIDIRDIICNPLHIPSLLL